MKNKIIELINNLSALNVEETKEKVLKIFDEFENEIKKLEDKAIWSVGEDDKYQGQYDGQAMAYGKVLKLLNE